MSHSQPEKKGGNVFCGVEQSVHTVLAPDLSWVVAEIIVVGYHSQPPTPAVPNPNEVGNMKNPKISPYSLYYKFGHENYFSRVL